MKLLLICALAFCAPAAEALDTLMVGTGPRNWSLLRESARFAGVADDSIWTWQAPRGVNLATGLAQRGGNVLVEIEILTITGTKTATAPRDGLPNWTDGDAGSAWGPDEDEGVERRGTFYIDLGGTFRVDRIRFFPRLDNKHKGLILGSFAVATSSGDDGPPLFSRYRNVPRMAFDFFNPNRQSVVDVLFERRDVRYIRLQSAEGEPWELAEFEVYAEGSVPMGEFTSAPLFIRGGFPIWGQVFYEDGPVEKLPITLQTRTGPDEQPLHYFLRRGDELEQVSQRDYERFNPLDFAGAAQVELGPVRANPEWSLWQTVVEGLVVSPAPRRYIQFRVLMAEPGTVIKELFFEYVEQPLVDVLRAEVSPLVVDAGVEIQFTLSLEVQLNPGRGDTGFRYLQVRTPALVGMVERVLVDDEEVVFTPTYDGEGFTVDIWQRIIQSGTFVQVIFNAAILRDGTAFEVRALDLRPEADGIESVYQTASPADVDPFSVGGELVVRLNQDDLGLLDALTVEQSVLTPNGDGVNDVFAVAYNLLKLTRSVPVFFQIFDLGGRLQIEGVSEDRHGRFTRLWRGLDARGQRVEPGLYIYRVKVEADVGVASRQGVVQVAY